MQTNDLMSQSQVLKHSIGIDVSKDSLSVCSCKLMEDLQKEFVLGKDVPNTPHGFRSLLKWIRSIEVQGPAPVVLLEATGVYHEALAEYLYASGITVSIMQSGRVKRYAQSLDQRSKTDLLDSKMLSMLGSERSLSPWTPPSKLLRLLKGLSRERSALVRAKSLEKNRAHALEHSSHGNRRTEGRYEKRMKLYKTQIAEIELEMRALIASDVALSQKMAYLESIPGVSFIASATVVSETLGFSSITSAKQLASFVGYDVVLRESGNFKGRTRISKKGNKHIRAVLHMPSMAAIRVDSTLRPFYLRLKAKKEKPIIGLVATQRKLLLLMYALWKKEIYYEPEIAKKRTAGPKEPAAQDSNLMEQVTS